MVQYHEVTEEEAITCKRPAYWYSVEGSARMVEKVVNGAVPYVGSLFLQQYVQEEEQFKKALDMCFQTSAGCMLFDLCYIEDYNWWNICKR